jgi:pyruvate/2-oxoglutarate dehydrogenase complex dihydrolipoamide dehydrogenase (E3) component
MDDYDMVVIGSGPSGRRAERSEAIRCHYAVLWIVSRSLSPGAHSRDPLARKTI